MTRRHPLLGVLVASALALALLAPAAAQAHYTWLSDPFRSAQDIASVPECADGGAVGVAHNSTNLFVTSACNDTLYRFGPDGGAPEASAANGLNAGLAFAGGKFYGLADDSSSKLKGGVYRFDPVTLKLITTPKQRVAVLPGNERDIAVDPNSGDLFVTTDAGALYRIQNPDTLTPQVDSLMYRADMPLDGVAMATSHASAGTSSSRPTVYVVSAETGRVRSFGHSAAQGYKMFTNWTLADRGPSGVVVRQPLDRRTDASLFIASHDGTIVEAPAAKGSLGGSNEAPQERATGDEDPANLAKTGSDGCLYVTSGPNVQRLGRCVFDAPCNVVGTSNSDTLNGTPAGDTLCGLAGEDTINGGAGDDKFYGGTGSDHEWGNAGDDEFGRVDPGGDDEHGGAGNDTFFAHHQPYDNNLVVPDFLEGGSGSDEFTFFNEEPGHSNTLFSRAVLSYADHVGPVTLALSPFEASPTVTGGEAGENDVIHGWPREVRGTNAGDDLKGGYAMIKLVGRGGDDTLRGTRDYVYTTPDRLEYFGGAGDDTIIGGHYSEYLHGEAGNDLLIGNEGIEHYYGGADDDTIRAADGWDETLVCGTGFDVFTADPGDTLTDCEAPE